MNKKDYTRPALEVIKLNAVQHLLNDSPFEGGGDAGSPTGGGGEGSELPGNT